VFGYIVAYYKVPVLIGDMLGGLSTSPLGLLIVIVALFILVGTFMDAAPAIIILMPILYPIANQAGIHPVHLGVVVVSTLALGLITPPYGLCLLIASLIADISFEKTIKTVMVFFSVMLAIVMFSVFFPDVILFIPRVLAPKLMGPM
jgi:TRAP-type C4-dicarboxylate transport system permease large subunit